MWELQGLEGCGQREGLVWLGLFERFGCSVIFGRDTIVLGRGSHEGLCILGFWVALWGLKGNGVKCILA